MAVQKTVHAEERRPLELADPPLRELPRGIVCAALGCVAVWSCLFGTGWLLYGYGGKTELVCRGWVAQGVAAAAAAALLCLVGRNKSEASGGKAT